MALLLHLFRWSYPLKHDSLVLPSRGGFYSPTQDLGGLVICFGLVICNGMWQKWRCSSFKPSLKKKKKDFLVIFPSFHVNKPRTSCWRMTNQLEQRWVILAMATPNQTILRMPSQCPEADHRYITELSQDQKSCSTDSRTIIAVKNCELY